MNIKKHRMSVQRMFFKALLLVKIMTKYHLRFYFDTNQFRSVHSMKGPGLGQTKLYSFPSQTKLNNNKQVALAMQQWSTYSFFVFLYLDTKSQVRYNWLNLSSSLHSIQPSLRYGAREEVESFHLTGPSSLQEFSQENLQPTASGLPSKTLLQNFLTNP